MKKSYKFLQQIYKKKLCNIKIFSNHNNKKLFIRKMSVFHTFIPRRNKEYKFLKVKNILASISKICMIFLRTVQYFPKINWLSACLISFIVGGLLPAPPMISPVPSKFTLIPSLTMVKK